MLRESVKDWFVKCIESIVLGIVKCLTILAPEIVCVATKFVIGHNILVETISNNSSDLLFDGIVVDGGVLHTIATLSGAQ